MRLFSVLKYLNQEYLNIRYPCSDNKLYIQIELVYFLYTDYASSWEKTFQVEN